MKLRMKARMGRRLFWLVLAAGLYGLGFWAGRNFTLELPTLRIVCVHVIASPKELRK